MDIDYGNIAVAVGITAGIIKIITNFLETQKYFPELYKYLHG
jgi:hypothetical protein